MFTSGYRCQDCGGVEAYDSRRRSWFEKFLLPVLLMKPVRCAHCYRRTSASLFTRVRPHTIRPVVPPRAA